MYTLEGVARVTAVELNADCGLAAAGFTAYQDAETVVLFGPSAHKLTCLWKDGDYDMLGWARETHGE